MAAMVPLSIAAMPFTVLRFIRAAPPQPTALLKGEINACTPL
jgi:hypothetical protein